MGYGEVRLEGVLKVEDLHKANGDRGENDLELTAIATSIFLGFPVIIDPKIPDGIVEFHHPDGRVDRFRLL